MGEKTDKLLVKLGWVGPYMREGDPVVRYWRTGSSGAPSAADRTAKAQRVRDYVMEAMPKSPTTRADRLAELNNDPYFSGDNDWGRSAFEWPELEDPSTGIKRKACGSELGDGGYYA